MLSFLKKDKWRTLHRIVGKGKVFTDEESLALYGYDASSQQGEPSAVVLVETTEDVQNVVQFAISQGLTVTPRGAGSGMSGGSVPIEGGILLSFERMKTMESMDPKKKQAIVQPGVVTRDLQENVRKYGLFYPPDPSSHSISTIGGNVAENAGGLRCFKYGVTGHFILGLEYINSEGEIGYTGSFNTGTVEPDLTHLLVGSEGTLGVFTRIALRLIQAPEATHTVSAFTDSSVNAFIIIENIISRGWVPSVLEYIDKQCLVAAASHVGSDFPTDAEAMLLIEFDGTRAETEEMVAQLRAEIEDKTIHVDTASTKVERDRLWEFRRALSPSLIKIATGKINEDIAVPRGNLARMAERVVMIKEKHNVEIALFGHAGDGNLHVVILYNNKDQASTSSAKEAARDVYRSAIELGGTISGEHGIGSVKRDFLPWQQSQSVIRFSRQIKKAFDPQGVFNPGKIF